MKTVKNILRGVGYVPCAIISVSFRCMSILTNAAAYAMTGDFDTAKRIIESIY